MVHDPRHGSTQIGVAIAMAAACAHCCSSSSAMEYMIFEVGSPAAGSSLLPGRTVNATWHGT